MKRKILVWLVTTQKATAALVGAAGVLGAATFLPAPWGAYVATVGVVGTWLLTYFFPYVKKTVETFPGDLGSGATVYEGEIIEPSTVETPIVTDDTTGIPVIEGQVVEGQAVDDWQPPFTGAIRVEDVLSRLAAERV